MAEANTKVGVLGVKVWICNGEVYGKRDLSPNAGVAASAVSANTGNTGGRNNNRRGGDRRDRGGDNRGPRRPRKED